MQFAYPAVLWLLIIVPLLLLSMLRRTGSEVATMRFSDLRAIQGLRFSWRIRLLPAATLLRLAAVGLLIVVVARPQRTSSTEKVVREGIDIQLTMDISLSMKAKDFEPKDRITVAKEVIGEFIKGRKDDRIGLVVFSGYAFTQVPLTLDYDFLLNLLGQVQTVRRPDGTAIGLALAHSVDALRTSETKTKIVILLSDGANNRGEIEPSQAAEIARTFDIRVYTILLGKPGTQEYPVYDPHRDQTYLIPGVSPEDEVALRDIAERTGGLFFTATDEQALREIYSKIDSLERSQVASERLIRYEEAWQPWAFGALILLAVEFLLRTTVLRSVQ
ncbi:MAG TPA: VWA domain-containing protein [Herpetosiphonaceae bacterium]